MEAWKDVYTKWTNAREEGADPVDAATINTKSETTGTSGNTGAHVATGTTENTGTSGTTWIAVDTGTTTATGDDGDDDWV